MDISKLPDHEIPNTAYSFNAMFAPRFLYDINKAFRHVETDMTGKALTDSHGVAYNLLRSTFVVDAGDNMVRPLTRVFLEQVQNRVRGKSEFISWTIAPQVEFSDLRLHGKDFKQYTLKASFTCR